MNINLVRDRKSGQSKGFCFLAYEDQRSTVLAVDNLNGFKVGGILTTSLSLETTQYRDEHLNKGHYGANNFVPGRPNLRDLLYNTSMGLIQLAERVTYQRFHCIGLMSCLLFGANCTAASLDMQ